MTKHDKIVQGVAQVDRLVIDGATKAYFDMQGALHTGFGGIRPEEFAKFARWVGSLAEEEDADAGR